MSKRVRFQAVIDTVVGYMEIETSSERPKTGDLRRAQEILVAELGRRMPASGPQVLSLSLGRPF